MKKRGRRYVIVMGLCALAIETLYGWSWALAVSLDDCLAGQAFRVRGVVILPVLNQIFCFEPGLMLELQKDGGIEDRHPIASLDCSGEKIRFTIDEQDYSFAGVVTDGKFWGLAVFHLDDFGAIPVVYRGHEIDGCPTVPDIAGGGSQEQTCNFSECPSQPFSVVIENLGRADLHIASVTLSGDDIQEFSIGDDSCSGQSVPAASSSGSSFCIVQVVFSPTSMGTQTMAILTVPSDDPDTPLLQVSLKATAIEPTAESTR
jgi:hypothetical protein